MRQGSAGWAFVPGAAFRGHLVVLSWKLASLGLQDSITDTAREGQRLSSAAPV